jgi:CubicO group peptidase (beta-lactamase class C family)
MNRRLVTAVFLLFPLASAMAGSAPAGAARQAESDALYERLEPLGWELTEKHRVPGVAIACIRAGALAWTLGCGYADVASERLVTGDTLFNIGSISKTVAAWGALELVERGKVELDAPIERYLTRWKLPPSEFDARGVTLRRLLSHTAGLSLHGYPGFPPEASLPTLEESLSGATNGAGDVRLVHAPGSKWQYSGGGYTLAQLLIEEVGGRSFAEFMRSEVLLPLGMEHSDYRWTEEVARLAATPYDEEGQPFGGPRFTALAAAGLQTSANELARFACASLTRFRGDTPAPVLERATLELMQTPAAAAPEYGLGYQVEQRGAHLVIGHGGANQGWMASLKLVPASGDGIVLLTNGSNGQYVLQALERAWIETLASTPPTPGK